LSNCKVGIVENENQSVYLDLTFDYSSSITTTAKPAKSTLFSLFQQVETKTRKLRKLFTKLQAVKQDISDVTEEYNRDRRDLVIFLKNHSFFNSLKFYNLSFNQLDYSCKGVTFIKLN
jgi:hypothetical protein